MAKPHTKPKPKSKPKLSWVHVLLPMIAFVVVLGLGAFVDRSSAAAPSVVTLVVPVPSNEAVTLTWSNPAEVDFTGTMVRYSTTSFPTSITSGTLAADVAGFPSGTSSTVVSGLTNGTTYFFSLFSHNAIPEYSAAVNTQQLVMPTAFSDDFESDTVGAINGQNGWATLGGTWNVIDTAGEQTLQSSNINIPYETNRVLNGGTVNTYSDQMLRADWKGSTTSVPGQVFLRAQSASADAAGYFMWQSGGTLRIAYKTLAGGIQVQLGATAFTPVAGTWYTYEFSVINNAAGRPVLTGYVWARGTAKPSLPSLRVTDVVNRFAQGVFSVGKTGLSITEYDNIIYSGRIGDSRANVAPGHLANTITWTNPTYATYSGTMVRASTSAYPVLPTDGTLVGDVSGTSGATSNVEHSGLTNGTVYFYTLFPYDNANQYGTPLRLSQIAYPSLFTDNFNARTLGTIVGQGGWTSSGGTWVVADVASERVLNGSSTATTYPTNKAINGASTTTDQILFSRFKSDTASNTTGYVWLRYQSNGSGYLVWHNENAWNISHYVGGVLTTLATSVASAAPPMEANAWFNQEVSVIDDGSGHPVIKLYLWRDGMERPTIPNLQATDMTDQFTEGMFALGRNTAAAAYYDDVAFYGSGPALTITSPNAEVAGDPDVATRAIVDDDGTFYIPYIQTSTTLDVAASAGGIPSGGGIQFVLNEGLAGEEEATDLSLPYTASFFGLAKGEYTVDAYVLGADGLTPLGGEDFHDLRTNVAIGDIITVVGDSVVGGHGGTSNSIDALSWLDADVGTASADNRNFPQYNSAGGTYNSGFLAELNDRLSTYYGYPIFLMNEGRGGIRANNYESVVMIAGWQARQNALDANKWIVALGINDNRVGDSPATFETNLTDLLNTFIDSYGATAENIWLTYPFYDFGGGDGPYAPGLATYLPIIDAVRSDLGLQDGADLYNTFAFYQDDEYTDNVHPNQTGYDHMARLIYLSMISPTLDTPAVDDQSATLIWNDLSLDEPTIAGYRVNYGTSPDSLTSSQTATTNAKVITGLAGSTTYYFSVEGYDDDANFVSYSDDSPIVSATTEAVLPSSGGGGSAYVPPSSSTAITIQSPEVGDQFDAGEEIDLRWTWTSTIPYVNVDVRIDTSSSWISLVDDQPNTGSLRVQLPDVDTSEAQLRIVGTDLVTTISSAISEVFTIGLGNEIDDGPTDPEIQAVKDRVAALPAGVDVHDLVKLKDDGDILSQRDTAVYYIGADGRRHIFPNSKVYFSWYCDFSEVELIDRASLASIPLGSNVTYRPGTSPVKFITVPKVYAVDLLGVLRWVTTEEIATELYGRLWNLLVEDIADTLFPNYVFGTDLTDADQYNADTAKESTTYPSDVFVIPGYEVISIGELSCPD